MLVFEERGKPEYPEKNLSEQSRETNKLNPHMTPSAGIEPGTHWWKASALTTAPTLACSTVVAPVSAVVMASQGFMTKTMASG